MNISSSIKRLLLPLSVSAWFMGSSYAFSTEICTEVLENPNWTCETGDGQSCAGLDIENYKQIITLPVGFQNQGVFTIAQSDLVAGVSRRDVDQVFVDEKYVQTFTRVYNDKLMYLSYWGPEMDFNATYVEDPLRSERRLSTDDLLVDQAINGLKTTCGTLQPESVIVLFTAAEDGEYLTANASLPNQVRSDNTKPGYGIARVSLANTSSVVIHELGHSLMAWQDEYFESGLVNTNISELEVLSPLFVEGLWADSLALDLLGVYRVSVAKILMGNGADNTSIYTSPARVPLSQDAIDKGVAGSELFDGVGGRFGLGVYHADHSNGNTTATNNVMGSTSYVDIQSASQERVMEHAFGEGAGRVNDRITNAGPPSGFPFAEGASMMVLLSDEDKNHHFHPTTHYEIQVSYYKKGWKTCTSASGNFTYSCYRVLVSDSYVKTIDLSQEAPLIASMNGNDLYQAVANLVDFYCLSNDTYDLGGVNLCAGESVNELVESLLGGVRSMALPYHVAHIPTPVADANYSWKFRTYNGLAWSEWTAWSTFK